MPATTASAGLNDMPLVSELPVEHLCDFSVDLEPAQLIATPVATRMTFIAKGGRVEGPRLKGEILPGGGDWLVVGSDQIGRIDVRATLARRRRADPLHGRRRHQLPADGLQRLAAGERLPFEDTYVRTTPKFESGDERYAWLNSLVCVGYNELSPDHIDYRIYRVL